jgi:hypothetical protein
VQFLTDAECRTWAEARHYPTGESPFSILADAPPFATFRFRIPADAGRRVAVARSLWTGIAAGEPEVLVWVMTWSVWPSGQHLPLAEAARAGLGASAPIDITPGSLARMGEDDAGLSMVSLAILFLWDCWLLAADGTLAVFLSHDEYGEVCSRGERHAQLIRALAYLEVLDDTAAA